MTLEQWAFVGQIVSAIAVIASLVFIGVQLTQTTSALRAASEEAGIAFARDVGLSLSKDADLARIWAVGLADPKALNEVEWVRFIAWVVAMFGTWEWARNQCAKGRLDDQIWHQFETLAADLAHLPGMQLARKLRGHWFSAEFRAWFDSLPAAQTPTLFARD